MTTDNCILYSRPRILSVDCRKSRSNLFSMRNLAISLSYASLSRKGYLRARSLVLGTIPCFIFWLRRLYRLIQPLICSCYFNILSLCWDYISANRAEPIILFLDEGHIALDPRLPEVGLYLRNLAKRIRKYEGGLWFCSQSSADMLHDSIRMSGQAIVDNAAYKILFHCDAKNLQDTVDLFQLTPAEAKLLSNLERKNALSVIGSTHHIRTIFEIPQYKLDLMGQGGGR